MLALRHCTVFSMCALAVGCFLDQSPVEDALSETGTTSSAANGGRAGSMAFTPRDPGVPTGQGDVMDGGAAEMPGAPNNNAPSAMLDAATQAPGATTGGAGASGMDAGAAPGQGAAGAQAMQDAQVAMMDAASTAVDAHVASDAGTTDARVTDDAATAPPDAGLALLPAPIHRYDFSGMGRTAEDLIGDADARLHGNTRLDGSGVVQFFPVNAEQQPMSNGVELPDRLLSGLSAFTILGWLELRSDECMQRLIDFTYVSEAQPGMGMGMGNGQTEPQVAALYLTPLGCPDNLPTVGYVTEQDSYSVESDAPLRMSMARRVQIGAMYDSNTRALQLIVDGEVRAQERVPINMRELGRAACGLGRSYFQDDPALLGSIDELRIYAQTFDEATLAEIARRGPDQL